ETSPLSSTFGSKTTPSPKPPATSKSPDNGSTPSSIATTKAAKKLLNHAAKPPKQTHKQSRKPCATTSSICANTSPNPDSMQDLTPSLPTCTAKDNACHQLLQAAASSPTLDL